MLSSTGPIPLTDIRDADTQEQPVYQRSQTLIERTVVVEEPRTNLPAPQDARLVDLQIELVASRLQGKMDLLGAKLDHAAEALLKLGDIDQRLEKVENRLSTLETVAANDEKHRSRKINIPLLIVAIPAALLATFSLIAMFNNWLNPRPIVVDENTPNAESSEVAYFWRNASEDVF